MLAILELHVVDFAAPRKQQSWSTRVSSFKSKVMRRPFGSELSNVFNSRRCSASIRRSRKRPPLRCCLVILSILFPLFKNSYFCAVVRDSHISCDGNHSSNKRYLRRMISCRKMSETFQNCRSPTGYCSSAHCGLADAACFSFSPGFAFAKASVRSSDEGPSFFPDSWQRSPLQRNCIESRLQLLQGPDAHR